MNAMRFTRSAPSLRTLGNPSPADAPWRDLPHVAVEICLENVEGVRISARAGADRALPAADPGGFLNTM